MNNVTVLEKLREELKEAGYRAILCVDSKKNIADQVQIKGTYICFDYNESTEVVIQLSQDDQLNILCAEFNSEKKPLLRMFTKDMLATAKQVIHGVVEKLTFTDEFSTFSKTKEADFPLHNTIQDTVFVISAIHQMRMTAAFTKEVFSNPQTLKSEYSSKLNIQSDTFNWTPVYLYLCDLESGVTKSINYNRVCAYFGVEPLQVMSNPTPSPTVMIKLFGGENLTWLSDAVNVPVNSLRNWFTTKPIIFHALLMFAISR